MYVCLYTQRYLTKILPAFSIRTHSECPTGTQWPGDWFLSEPL